MRIGFAGRARSGKDTSAVFAQRLTKIPIWAVAQPLKDVLQRGADFDTCQMYGDEKDIETSCHFDRLVLITQVVQQYGETRERANNYVNKFFSLVEKTVTHCDVAHHSCSAYMTPRKALQLWGTTFRDAGEDYWVNMIPEHCIVSDVRYDNEARACDVVFQVVRPDQTIVADSDHVSEAGISQDLITAVIHNDSTLHELETRVMDAIYVHCDTDVL